jgi:hypothetical protein
MTSDSDWSKNFNLQVCNKGLWSADSEAKLKKRDKSHFTKPLWKRNPSAIYCLPQVDPKQFSCKVAYRHNSLLFFPFSSKIFPLGLYGLNTCFSTFKQSPDINARDAGKHHNIRVSCVPQQSKRCTLYLLDSTSVPPHWRWHLWIPVAPSASVGVWIPNLSRYTTVSSTRPMKALKYCQRQKTATAIIFKLEVNVTWWPICTAHCYIDIEA